MSTRPPNFGAVVVAGLVVLAVLAFGAWHLLTPPATPVRAVPGGAEPLPADPEARERAARVLLDQATAAADRGQWQEATRHLDALEAEHAHTSVYMLSRHTIAVLRATAQRGGAPESPRTVPPEPRPRKPWKSKRTQPLTFTGKTLTIEAEEPDVLIEPMEVADDQTASGGQFVWEPREPEQGQFSGREARAVYYVRSDRERRVCLYGCVRTPTDAENSLLLAVEPGKRTDGDLKEWHFAPNPGWTWAAFGAGTRADRTARQPTLLRLRAGTNSIIIAVRERATALDRIRIMER